MANPTPIISLLDSDEDDNIMNRWRQPDVESDDEDLQRAIALSLAVQQPGEQEADLYTSLGRQEHGSTTHIPHSSAVTSRNDRRTNHTSPAAIQDAEAQRIQALFEAGVTDPCIIFGFKRNDPATISADGPKQSSLAAPHALENSTYMSPKAAVQSQNPMLPATSAHTEQHTSSVTYVQQEDAPNVTELPAHPQHTAEATCMQDKPSIISTPAVGAPSHNPSMRNPLGGTEAHMQEATPITPAQGASLMPSSTQFPTSLPACDTPTPARRLGRKRKISRKSGTPTRYVAPPPGQGSGAEEDESMAESSSSESEHDLRTSLPKTTGRAGMPHWETDALRQPAKAIKGRISDVSEASSAPSWMLNHNTQAADSSRHRIAASGRAAIPDAHSSQSASPAPDDVAASGSPVQSPPTSMHHDNTAPRTATKEEAQPAAPSEPAHSEGRGTFHTLREPPDLAISQALLVSSTRTPSPQHTPSLHRAGSHSTASRSSFRPSPQRPGTPHSNQSEETQTNPYVVPASQAPLCSKGDFVWVEWEGELRFGLVKERWGSNSNVLLHGDFASIACSATALQRHYFRGQLVTMPHNSCPSRYYLVLGHDVAMDGLRFFLFTNAANIIAVPAAEMRAAAQLASQPGSTSANATLLGSSKPVPRTPCLFRNVFGCKWHAVARPGADSGHITVQFEDESAKDSHEAVQDAQPSVSPQVGADAAGKGTFNADANDSPSPRHASGNAVGVPADTEHHGGENGAVQAVGDEVCIVQDSMAHTQTADKGCLNTNMELEARLAADDDSDLFVDVSGAGIPSKYGKTTWR